MMRFLSVMTATALLYIIPNICNAQNTTDAANAAAKDLEIAIQAASQIKKETLDDIQEASKLTMQVINEWLHNIEVQEHITLKSIYIRGSDPNSNEERELRFSDQLYEDDTKINAKEYKLLLRFVTNRTNNGYQKLLDNYSKANDYSFHDKLISKIALTSNLKRTQFLVSVSTDCGNFSIYPLENGEKREISLACAFTKSTVKINPDGTREIQPYIESDPDDVNFFASGDSKNIRPDKVINLSEIIPEFFEDYLPDDANTTVTGSTEAFVEVFIRGIKGFVIKGGADWEKVQLLFTKSIIEGEPVVHIYADGLLSSGIGNYPKDSQFTKSIEPSYTSALQEFVNNTAYQLSEFLRNHPKQYD